MTKARSLRSTSVACRLLGAAAVSGAMLASSSSAQAAGLNDPNCKPSAARPYPVVVVHGQAGNFEGMTGVTNALVGAGYCVYAKNYGYVPGGANGQDHLSTSANQIGALVDEVLSKTGAAKVNVVGHSAGVGVLDNLILKKGGAAKIHRAAMFGGLHHPYAHAGAAKVLDATLYLPNMIAVARKFVPGITAPQVVKTALDAYAAVGAPLGMVDPGLRATMESNFTADLFDPDYWQDLHGGQSEPATSFVKVGQSERTKLTNDSAPNVCYTNIVAIADLLAGATTGFQDEAPNVDNFVLLTSVTTNAHNDMLGDPVALAKMLAAFDSPCTPAPPKAPGQTLSADEDVEPTAADSEAASAFESALGEQGERRTSGVVFDGGCSVTSRTTSTTTLSGGLAGLALGFLAWCRRRSSRGV
jgi:pimeloyl-ACP methyl ester carboxylesterase